MNWRRFDTLFLRLFLLMWAALVISHFAAFSVATPPAPGSPPGAPPGGPPPGSPPGAPPGPPRDRPQMPVMPSLAPNDLPRETLWLDYAVRMLVIALAAAVGARWLAGGTLAGALPVGLFACGGGSGTDSSSTSADTSSTSSTSSSSSSSSSSTSSTATSTATSSCTAINDETSGPYPADGTNSNSSGVVNVLTQTGIVRSDIRSSFGGASGVAAGVPLTVTLQLVNSASSCASLAGYAVYLWHCNRDGNYSLYASGLTGENYLRGLQQADSNGQVTFTTIFPACYSGRWPHIHFEVYRSLAVATSGTADVKTSQLALPAAACNQVYGIATGYDASVNNFKQVSLATDNVFSDDQAAHQIPAITGDVTNGFAATLVVGVAA